MIVSCIYGFCITGVAYVCDTRFRQLFSDFKVSLPLPTTVVMSISHCIWSYFGWAVLIPVLTLWPLAIRLLPTPAHPESRRAVARTARWLIFFIYLFTGILIALALFTPVIPLIQSVSGPQKH